MSSASVRIISPIGLIVLSAWFTAARAQSTIVDSLQSQLAIHRDDTIGLKVAQDIAFELSRTNLRESRTFLYQGISTARKLNTTYCLSGFYSLLTTSYQNSGHLDSARKYMEMLRHMSEQMPTPDTKTNYHLTAGLFFKNTGQFEKALPHMLSALEFLGEKKHEVTLAGQLLNIGNTYTNLGDIEKAAEYHLQALKRFESLDNKRGVSFCLQSLGNDFTKLKQYQKSIEYYERSLKIKHALNDRRGIVSAWNSLGNVYAEKSAFGKALKTYQLALKQARQMKLESEEAHALFNIGILQWKMNKHLEARRFLLEALTLARKSGDSLSVSSILASIAQIEFNSKALPEKVETQLQKKIEIATQAGDQSSVAEAYLALAKHYFSTKEFDKAYAHLKIHQGMTDSLRGLELAVRFRQMEQEYQNEKKEKEIALLKKDQELTRAVIAKQTADQRIIVVAFVSMVILALISIQHIRLRNRSRQRDEINKVRNNIARDLHDDIGSALSSIHIISQLALQDQHGIPGHLQKISDSSARTMESMSDIVWSIDPENESVEKLVVKMKEFAGEILESKNIRYSFEVNDKLKGMKLDVKTRKNLFLIFKESVNNAAKYSKCTEVVIALHLDSGNLNLTVKDDGQGFESSSVRYGNGIANMAARTKNIDGKFTHTAAPGRGTAVIVQLPVT